MHRIRTHDSRKILIITNVASHYRREFWEHLVGAGDVEVVIVSGKSKGGIKAFEIESEQLEMITCENIYLSKYLVFQCFDYSMLFKNWDAVVLLGEVQLLSSWFFLAICRLRGLKTIVWTHGLYGSEAFLLKWLRIGFYDSFQKIIVYNRRSKELLIDEGIEASKICVIYNSFEHDALRRLSNTESHRDDVFFNLVFVGRLTEIKRLDLAVQALSLVQSRGIRCSLQFIGEGPLHCELEQLAEDLGVGDVVHFHGAIYGVAESAQIIKNCHLGISPGNVGLTAIHLLSLGVPVVTHDNFSEQMPEAEIIEPGVNGSFFSQGSVEALADEIMYWAMRYRRGTQPILRDCRMEIDQHYNPIYQTRVFRQAIGVSREKLIA